MSTPDPNPTPPTPPSDNIDWHDLFGVVIANQIRGLPYTLEIDYNVARSDQRIDLLLKKNIPAAPAPILPDGFENLQEHNLLSFKSFQEPMDAYAIFELCCYGFLYMKMITEKGKEKWPLPNLGLYAIATRRPVQLFKVTRLKFHKLKSGVYDVECGTSDVRLIVINELKQESQNSNLLLLSNNEKQIEYGKKSNNLDHPDFMFSIWRLQNRDAPKGANVAKPKSFTMESFREFLAAQPNAREQLLRKLPNPEQFEAVPTEELLLHLPTSALLPAISFDDDLTAQLYETYQRVLATDRLYRLFEGIPIEKRLEGIPTEKRLEGIPTEKRLEGINAAEIAKNLSPEQLQELLKIAATLPKADSPSSN